MTARAIMTDRIAADFHRHLPQTTAKEAAASWRVAHEAAEDVVRTLAILSRHPVRDAA